MEIPVLIEPVGPNGFRARSGEPFGLTAEGATREEALQKLREMVQNRIAAAAGKSSRWEYRRWAVLGCAWPGFGSKTIH